MRALLVALMVLSGCGAEEAPGKRAEVVPDAGPEPSAVIPAPALRRLTSSQYLHTIVDLFGDELILPTRLEPDEAFEGLLVIGATTTALSPLGVEQYEEAAWQIAAQVVAPGPIRDRLVGCEPADVVDDACVRDVLEPLMRRAWRRPASPEELDLLVEIAAEAATTLDDFDAGLEFAIGAMLQSPSFLYRAELGDGATLTDWELAGRLSYFLWNTTPDDALLGAVEAGTLSTPDGLAAEVDRMLADDRARVGFRNFVNELLRLYRLDELSKDPEIFPAMRAEIGPAAREETLAAIDALVFDRDDDFRTWLTTRETVIDRNLAMVYGVPAPAREGFGTVMLPSDGPRRGLLGQVSILAQYAHPVSTSATLRGKFVREVLLCQVIPPPPADVDTSIPEASPDAPTRRERVERHLEDPTCAGCHMLTDPIGLGLEPFDGLGIHRTTENGATIDASGELDGDPYDDANGLARAIHDHHGFPSCMAEMIMSYAVGHRPEAGEQAWVAWLDARFAEEEYSMKALLRSIAMSARFRQAAPVDDGPLPPPMGVN